MTPKEKVKAIYPKACSLPDVDAEGEFWGWTIRTDKPSVDGSKRLTRSRESVRKAWEQVASSLIPQ